MTYQKVVIIGAPRSGTNMLRDLVNGLPGVATWPCDEINHIWRHGNVRYPSDEFEADMATPRVRRYIERCFDRIARKYGAHTVLEKTCANSLRVGFVKRVLPNAKYIVIRRDGVDAAASAATRWKAGPDIKYVARKARYVPMMDIPYHALSYTKNLVRKVSAKRGRKAGWWGPMLSDMEELSSNYTLEQLCILQWKRCVDRTDEALQEMQSNEFREVKYETFVESPMDEIERIAGFLNLAIPDSYSHGELLHVTDTNVGKGPRSLNRSEVQEMRQIAGDTLSRHGYVGA